MVMVRSVSSATVSALKPPESLIASARQALSAPGTTGMQFSKSNARFSRFWLVTYSSACQRVSQLIRLPTFTFPATAPTLGIDKMPDKFADGVGLDRSVGVDGHDNAARSFGEGMRKRSRLSADWAGE